MLLPPGSSTSNLLLLEAPPSRTALPHYRALQCLAAAWGFPCKRLRWARTTPPLTHCWSLSTRHHVWHPQVLSEPGASCFSFPPSECEEVQEGSQASKRTSCSNSRNTTQIHPSPLWRNRRESRKRLKVEKKKKQAHPISVLREEKTHLS